MPFVKKHFCKRCVLFLYFVFKQMFILTFVFIKMTSKVKIPNNANFQNTHCKTFMWCSNTLDSMLLEFIALKGVFI